MAELKIVTMRDVQAESVQWLWEPYIPLGKLTIIQGDGGEGKTTMALVIAAAITRGDKLPGSGGNAAPSDGLRPAHVIIQNAEDGLADTIIPRLEQLGAVAARTGCAILLVGHLGKKGGKSQYRGLGSIDIYAAARSVLTVGRIDVDENMRAVVHGKSNLAAPGASLAFGLDPISGFCWLGEYDISIDELLRGKPQRPENQFARARRLIETTLAHGAVTAVEIMQIVEEQGISIKTLNRAKSALGVISLKRFDGWY